MTRGIWRWWVGETGAEIWWARVERQPGEFVDAEASQHEAEQYPPPFWKLPLKEEHMEGLADGFLRSRPYFSTSPVAHHAHALDMAVLDC